MSNPFKFVGAINSGKTIEVDSDYVKFLVNRAFSYHLDTVLIANAINMYPNLSNQMHYEFLSGIIKPKKRFGKWAKPVDQPRAATVSKYFNISMHRAYEEHQLFTDEQIDQMAEIMQQKETTK